MCLKGGDWPILFDNNIFQVIKKNHFKGEGLTLLLGYYSLIGYLT